MGSMHARKVSIIVPAFNAGERMRPVLESILALNYPRELMEVIVVDNGSQDGTRDIVREYPVILFEENEIQSSYAARNKGIRHASGEILAFIDADCVVDGDLLKNAMSCLDLSGAHLIAGNIITTRSKRCNVAELYESNMYGQQKYNATVGASTTGNLIVRREVFDRVGLFPAVKSGADVRWTRKATRLGFKLVYCESAKVFHPARTRLSEVLEKEVRLISALGVVSSLLKVHVREIYGKVRYGDARSIRRLGVFLMLFFLKNVFKRIALVIFFKRALTRTGGCRR